MKTLTKISKVLDKINIYTGAVVQWLVLLVVIVSAGNAIVRKVFSISSNTWLELQWYMFGAIFLLASGYTYLKDQHVRVDVFTQSFSRKTQIKIELFGVLFFLLPFAVLMAWLSWPMFVNSFVSGEMSSNAGGLIRWPARLLIPVGFVFLILAAVSQIFKCVNNLLFDGPDPKETFEK